MFRKWFRFAPQRFIRFLCGFVDIPTKQIKALKHMIGSLTMILFVKHLYVE